MVKKAIKKLKRKTARIVVKHRVYKKARLTAAREKARRKRMSCFILTLAAVLLIIPAYVFFHHKISLHNNAIETAQNQELYSIAGIIYRHMDAYPTYCKKTGYKMQSYAKVFRTDYEQEVVAFGVKARQKGLTPDKIIQKTRTDFSSVTQKAIKKEFEKIRQRGIMQTSGHPLSNDEEICRYLDENASLWLKTEKKEEVNRLKRFAGTLK